MNREWKIKSQRKDPRSSIVVCKYCLDRPTRWYKLMATTVYRCEKHKRMITSPVYDQGRLSSKGECIGMEFNPTFEVGVQREIDYRRKSGTTFDQEALENETNSCKDEIDHGWIKEGDPDYVEKIKKLVEHLRKKHPILFSHQTYYDEKGEHNLLIEHPDDYYLTKVSKDQVTDHYKYIIPPELVGEDFSAKELREKIQA